MMKRTIKYLGLGCLGIATLLYGGAAANATIINNDIAAGTLGHMEADVGTGGNVDSLDVTVSGAISGQSTKQVIYDYFTYIDVGSGGSILSGSAPALSGDDEVTSTGSFAGSTGNTINWSAVSSIDDGGALLTTMFVFSAATGTLGDITLYQYLDEDVDGFSDDVFFTQGSVGGGDLELFTVDDDEVYGVSHSGALSAAQGLVNSYFDGWAACTFNTQKPDITAGTQSVSLAGDICAGLLGSAYVHPTLGFTVYGPLDIVSVLAWSVDPQAQTATIITTLGGVPTASDIPRDIPEPATGAIFLFGLGGLFAARRRRG